MLPGRSKAKTRLGGVVSGVQDHCINNQRVSSTATKALQIGIVPLEDCYRAVFDSASLSSQAAANKRDRAGQQQPLSLQ